jgi:hypothetical protein
MGHGGLLVNCVRASSTFPRWQGQSSKWQRTWLSKYRAQEWFRAVWGPAALRKTSLRNQRDDLIETGAGEGNRTLDIQLGKLTFYL